MIFPPRLPIPEVVRDIAQRLEDAGFETWCVGGAVRDNLLGYANGDFDLATAATPQEIQRCFRRTIPLGVEHGTVGVLDRNNRPHEVTTFRRDVKTDGRRAVVEFGASLDDDLARRDFTINAIAYHALQHKWRDPLDGASDLDAKVIRSVGEPDQRFREDYLRILRALRFAARFEFTIEQRTLNAARRNVDGIKLLSAERVRDEWFKGLTTAAQAAAFVRSWQEIGATEIWLPELAGATEQDVAQLDRLPKRDPVLMTSFLSEDAQATLRRLRCSNAEVDRGARFTTFRDVRPNPESDVDVRRWLAKVGAAADDLVAISMLREPEAGLSTTVERVRRSGVPLTLGDLAVDGDDLLALGLSKGPIIGKVLEELLDEVLEDPARNERAGLLEYARRRVETEPSRRDSGPAA